MSQTYPLSLPCHRLTLSVNNVSGLPSQFTMSQTYPLSLLRVSLTLSVYYVSALLNIDKKKILTSTQKIRDIENKLEMDMEIFFSVTDTDMLSLGEEK